MAKILVTGAAGFIGSRVSNELVLEGHEVLGVDNFNSYYNPKLKELRVSDLLKNQRTVELNLKDLDGLRNLVKDFEPESVMHFAGQPGVRLKVDSWNQYVEDNLVSFSNVLQCSTQFGISNFLYASSSSVYGNLTGKTSEDIANLSPQSFYGATKLANEVLAKANSSDMRTRGLRFFSVYGEYGRPDMAYFKIAGSILTKKSFTKFGKGDATRDFTHIADVSKISRALLAQMNMCSSGENDVVNIGGGNPHSLNDLIKELENNLGVQAKIVENEANKLDALETHADTSYLYSLIDERHQIDFSTGVRRFSDWIQSHDSKTIDQWITSI
jgi:UDP-glucuronate 4-epimerase